MVSILAGGEGVGEGGGGGVKCYQRCVVKKKEKSTMREISKSQGSTCALLWFPMSLTNKLKWSQGTSAPFDSKVEPKPRKTHKVPKQLLCLKNQPGTSPPGRPWGRPTPPGRTYVYIWLCCLYLFVVALFCFFCLWHIAFRPLPRNAIWVVDGCARYCKHLNQRWGGVCCPQRIRSKVGTNV